MITPELINHLVNKASKHGARGYEVIGWIPPSTATEKQEGMLVLKNRNHGASSATEQIWYEKD